MLVLLIDDEVAVRGVVRAILAAMGHEVAEAGGGADGVRLARSRRPDVILCDMYMEAGDGLQTLSELRREAPGVPFIAMSGKPEGGIWDVLPAARALGAVATLNKPFTVAQLRDALATAAAP